PTLHDGQTCSPGGFRRTITGITHVKALGAHVRTNSVITAQNMAHLPSIAQLACKLGVDHLNFSNLHPVGSARFSLSWILPSLEDVTSNLGKAIEIGLQSGRRVTLEGFPYCAVPGHEDLH